MSMLAIAAASLASAGLALVAVPYLYDQRPRRALSVINTQARSGPKLTLIDRFAISVELVVSRWWRNLPELHANQRRALAICIALAAALVWLSPLAVVIPVLAGVWLWRNSVNEKRRVRQQLERDVPLVVDLLRLSVDAGLNASGAIAHVTRYHQGPMAVALGEALHQSRQGQRLVDALDAVVGRHGEATRNLIWCLTSAERYGAPLSRSLQQLAVETRLDQERQAEQSARRLTVQLLFPVAGALLPAFALLTVVPLLAGSLSTLATTFN